MTDTALPAQDKPVAMTGFLTFVFAVGCGLTAANLYYAQPLIGLIAPDIGLSDTLAGFVVTFTQIGYGLALLLIDRKSTRLNSVTNAHLVCRLLLEKKKQIKTTSHNLPITIY